VSSSVCVADDGENVYVFNPTDPGTPSPVSVASDDSLGGIACPAANECVAVGSDGNGFVFDPSSLSVAGATTEPLGSAAYYEIACASPTQCTAVGTTSLAGPWVAVTFNPQNPGSPQPAVIGAPTNNGLTGIACPSTSQCTAVGDGNDEITFNPADPGTPTIVPFSAPVASPGGMPLTTAEITCAAADECFATDNGTDAVDQGDPTVPGGDWTAETVPTGSASNTWGETEDSLACASPTLCVGVGEGATGGTITSGTSPMGTKGGTPGPGTHATVSHGSLSRLAAGKPRLRFSVSGGTQTAKPNTATLLRSLSIELPAGLSFVKSAKTLTRDIVALAPSAAVGAERLTFKITGHGQTITLTFKTPAPDAQLTISSGALHVTSRLIKRVRKGKVKSLTVEITATSANGIAKKLPLSLRA